MYDELIKVIEEAGDRVEFASFGDGISDGCGIAFAFDKRSGKTFRGDKKRGWDLW